LCNDNIENDNDGLTDCVDLNCVGSPFCPESANCVDGVDNDGDTKTDCHDTDCIGNVACPESQNCDDHVDNDGDGDADCSDEDCCDIAACIRPPQLDCPSNRTVCAGSVLRYVIVVSDDSCRNIPPRSFMTSGIPSGGVVPIGATTTSFTAIDSAGVTVSCSFTVVGNLDGQQCDDEISVTSDDRCVDSQLAAGGLVTECIGGCIAPVDTRGCPITDNLAFQFANNGAKFCTRISRICEGERCKTTDNALQLQHSINIGAMTLVGGDLVVANAALLLQFGGDYEISKLIAEDGGVVLVGVATSNNSNGGTRIEFAIDNCYVRLTLRDGTVKVVGGSLSSLPAAIVALLPE
jgi:hypothetical protein